MLFYQNALLTLSEEFAKVVTKLYFISLNYNIKKSKRKAPNSVPAIDQEMNDINTLVC